MKFRRYILELIVAMYAIIFLLTKNPANQWDRVIVSDGKGYYAYLTSLFIYHDTDFGFIDKYETRYYPAGNLLYKDFRFDTGNGIVNKYFPGCSVLWLPFFAGGHVAALLLGFPPDGYSMPYQLAIALAAFFYFWLALRLLRRILRFYISDENALAWTLAAIALGTNLVYYTVNAGSQVHVYGFFLINAFIFSILASCKWGKMKYLLSAAFMLGLIIITRPQNGLIVFAVPFLCGSRGQFQTLMKSVFFNWRTLILSFAAFALPLSIPITFWFLKTGHFFVYSYGNEYFDFANPHLFKFLLSFEKGWLIYTPMAAFSLIGLIFLYKKNKWQFYCLSVFLFSLVYFLSSWWVWNYTSFVGQRVMIDYYAIIGILLIFMFIWSKNIVKRMLVQIALTVFISLNLMQYAQHLIWVYPAGPVTANAYFSNFFSFSRGSTFMIPENEIAGKQVFPFTDETSPFFQTHDFSISTVCRSGTPSLLIDSQKNEKPLFVKGISDYLNLSPVILRISGWYSPSAVDSALLINIKVGNSKEIYSVNGHNLMPFLKAGKWKYAEAAMYLPVIRSLSDSLFVSFTNLSGGNVLFEGVNVEFLRMKPSGRFDWILPSEDYISSVSTYSTDMEAELSPPWGNQPGVTTDKSYSGMKSSFINKISPYSVVFEKSLNDSVVKVDGYLRVSSKILGGSSSEVLLVFDFTSDGKTVFYKTYPVIVQSGIQKWSVSEIFRELPVASLKADKVKIYYWYIKGNDPVYIDDLQVDIAKYKPLKLIKPLSVLSTDTLKTVSAFCYDFEKGFKPSSGQIVETNFAFSGNKVCKIDETNLYSCSQVLPLSLLETTENALVKISAMVNTNRYNTTAALVTDFRHNGKSSAYYPDYLRGQTGKGCWAAIDYCVKVPETITKNDSVLVYIYMPKSDEVLMLDDFCVSLLVPEKTKPLR